MWLIPDQARLMQFAGHLKLPASSSFRTARIARAFAFGRVGRAQGVNIAARIDALGI